jgi:hypothetical protein
MTILPGHFPVLLSRTFPLALCSTAGPHDRSRAHLSLPFTEGEDYVLGLHR